MNQKKPFQLPSPQRMRDRQRRTTLLAFVASAAVLVAVVAWQRSHSPQTQGSSLAASAPTIILPASLPRGATESPSASVRIPLAAPALRLQLEVATGDATTRYHLQIANARGAVFEAKALAARALGPYRFVEVTLAPTVLGSGDYRIELGVDGTATPPHQWTLRTHTE